MTATPPRTDLRTLATVAAHDVDCPDGPNCGDELTTDGRYGRYADAVLAAVLPEHRRMVLAEAADDLHRVATHLHATNPDSSVAKGVRYAEARIRAQLTAAPSAGLSVTVPAGNAPAVPEEADGQRVGEGVDPPRDDLDDPGIRAAIAEAAISCIGGDNIAWAEIRESVADVQPLIAELRKTRADRDRLAAQVAHCQRVVEAAKAWRAARPGPWVSGTDVEFHLFAAVDALPDAGTDQTEDDRG